MIPKGRHILLDVRHANREDDFWAKTEGDAFATTFSLFGHARLDQLFISRLSASQEFLFLLTLFLFTLTSF
jgi:hypothetical protein